MREDQLLLMSLGLLMRRDPQLGPSIHCFDLNPSCVLTRILSCLRRSIAMLKMFVSGRRTSEASEIFLGLQRRSTEIFGRNQQLKFECRGPSLVDDLTSSINSTNANAQYSTVFSGLMNILYNSIL